MDHVDRMGVNPGFTSEGRKYGPVLARALQARTHVQQGQLPASCWTGTLPQVVTTAQHAPFSHVEWVALEDARSGAHVRYGTCAQLPILGAIVTSAETNSLRAWARSIIS